MKHTWKLWACGAAAAAVLCGGALALSSGDSLISLNYLTGTFVPSAQKQMTDVTDKAMQSAYDQAIQKAQGTEGSGGLYSDNLGSRTFSQGDVVTLSTGAGFLPLSGSAQVSHGGAVVDVTAGSEVASGTKLTPGHRYLVGEDTTATITVLSGAMYMGLEGGYSLTEGSGSALPFVDVAKGDWFENSVRYVYEKGLFSGVSADAFGPSVTMDRAMMMTVFFRLTGFPQDEMDAADAQFSDVAQSSWYAPYVRWGASAGVTAGMGDGTFGPTQGVTRQQMLVMLHSFASRYLGLTLSGSTDLSAYADGSQVASWASEAVSWAVANGLIVPSDQGTLRPNDTVSRAEVATILMQFDSKFL